MTRFETFAQMESESWSEAARVSNYMDLFAPVTDQAVTALLDATAVENQSLVLDLCCGQGNVTQALAGRGYRAVGLDFSKEMLNSARKRVQDATFVEGDAQSLGFQDGTFKAVVSNFGICHVPDQPRALAEARRVLDTGGKFGMTVWCGPDQSPCFRILYEAIKTHGSPDVKSLPGPDFHQFSNFDTAFRLLSQAGFVAIGFTVVQCLLDLAYPEMLCEIFEKATARASHLLAQQPREHMAAIRAAIASHVASNFANNERFGVPMPAALVYATRN